MIKAIPFILMFCYSFAGNSQNENEIDSLPYHSIQSYPENNNSAAVLQRLIDGLGYRYYWATEKLSDTDLEYSASDDNRTNLEILEHIKDLSEVVNLFASGNFIERKSNVEKLNFATLRKSTLINLASASKIFSDMSDEEFYKLSIKFKRGEKESSFALWHIINGQITDAIYHVGQIVYNRRSAGNPMDPSVNVFFGKNR